MFPTWRFEIGGGILEKRITMPYLQNTVYVVYQWEGAGPLRMQIRPYIGFRGHDKPLQIEPRASLPVKFFEGCCEIRLPDEAPLLKLCLCPAGREFNFDEKESGTLFYRVERDRGHEALAQFY